MKLSLALLSGLLFLTACEMQQDPLQGAADQVRQGVPPATEKPTAAKPLPKEALQIDAPSLVNGRVGSPIDFKILGRVMSPGVDYQILIDNLSDFPGATFDANTGDFKWTPSKDQVGGFPSANMTLRVTLATVSTTSNPTISVEKKSIALVIQNTYSKPIVNSVTGPVTVVVGSSYNFEFVMDDVDALNVSDAALLVRDCGDGFYTESIAHLVDVRRIAASPKAPNRYEGQVRLDLSNVPNLPTGKYCFGLMAASKFGVVSEVYKTHLNIEAKMRSTKMTMNVISDIRVGEKIQVAFSIYDPTSAGNLVMKSMDDISQILPGSSLNCSRSAGARYQLDCRGVIDATSATEKMYFVNFVVENSGLSANQKITTNHTLNISVKPAVVP